MDIKGTLIAIGGNEDKGVKRKLLHVQDTPHDFVTSGILYRVVSEIADVDLPIEVITTASSVPKLVGKDYEKAFKKLGYKKVKVMHVETRQEADNKKILDRIAKAGCIMFSGGDQMKLASVFHETEFAELIHQRYVNEPLVIAGTSAGAMAMSDLMLYPAPGRRKGSVPEVRLFAGLALVHDTIIDTHFLVRGRFRRLAIAVSRYPTHLGIGLEEDTGIIIREGNKLEIIGSGLVTLIDGRSLRDHNQTVTQNKEHNIFLENLLVHILRHGDNFTLKGMQIS